MSDNLGNALPELEQRLRSILRTIVNGGEPITDAFQVGLENEIVGRVLEHIGPEGLAWQSYELIDQLETFYLKTGESCWDHDFDGVLSLPFKEGVSDYSLERVAARVAQFGGPQSLEAAVANSYLRYRWPASDGLIPSAPFRFLHRRVSVESIFGRDGSVDNVGDQVLREIEWVSSRLVISGALEGVHQISEGQAQERWVRLRSRIQGFLEAQQQAPEVVWEIAASPQPDRGQLFTDPQHSDRHQLFIRRCCEEQNAMPLQICVPLPIPGPIRQLLSFCLRTSLPPRIVWEQHLELPLVAGRLNSLPAQGVHAICQRIAAFDRIVADGAGPCWQGDWVRARGQMSPLWIATDKIFPPSCVDYLQRNSEHLQPFPVIAIEPSSAEKSRKDLKKLLDKISRRRGGGWDRLEELLQEAAIFGRQLAPIRDRA